MQVHESTDHDLVSTALGVAHDGSVLHWARDRFDVTFNCYEMSGIAKFSSRLTRRFD